jgi:hypothetical protein
MLSLDAVYHTGFTVTDLKVTQAALTAALGVEWAPVHLYQPLPLWRPGTGWTEVHMRVSYSRPGPHQLEIIEAPEGTFYDPAHPEDNRHLGLWTDDLGGEVNRLTAIGWEVLCAKGTPDQGYGTMAYVRPPGAGLVLELVSTELRPMLEAWFTEAA